MCGICGIVSGEATRAVDPAIAGRMNEALRHRGPDEGEVWHEGPAALGARRLSILDVAKGHQPMVSGDGRYVLVFNGEIYNFRELRGHLEAKGCTFETRCDTEVLLRAYETYGDDAVQHLNGMFAFAVYDTERKRLFAARDRMGIKPLYYTCTNGVCAFASELDALLRSGYVSGKLDAAALDAYFAFLYIPAPDTPFQNVQKLRPGQALVFENGTVSVADYWRPEFRIDHSWTLDSAAEAYLELLRDAVRLQRVSDVPLGAWLSGGMDSTSVVAVMSKEGGGTVKTYSIGFDDPEANELPYARAVAHRFETDHTEAILEPDLVEMAGDLVRHFGEPFADSSAIPTWLVSKLARDGVTVVLTGDGGDELFAGYTWAHMNMRVARYRRMPAGLRSLVHTALRLVPAFPFAEKVRRFSGDSFLHPHESFRRRQTCFDAEQRAALFSGEVQESISASAADRFQEHLDEAPAEGDDWMLWQDLRMYLPGDVLTKVDRMSMANSLEARVPLLDHRIVEFAATVPFHLKYEGGVSKRLVKHAFKDLIPGEVAAQRKRGFALPIQRWFREDLQEHFRAAVLDGDALCAAYIDMQQIRRLFDAHQTRRANYGHHLWTLLTFELWLRYLRTIPGFSVDL